MARLTLPLLCLILALVGGAVWGQVAQTPAQSAPGADSAVSSGGDPFDIAGKIVRIVPGDNTHAPGIVLKPANRDPVLINVTRRTEITKNGRPAGFGDLEVGDLTKCRVVLRERALWALAIAARTAGEPPIEVQGVIVEVNLDRRVVAIQPERGDPVRFLVTDDTVIEKNGEPARLAEIIPGDLGKALLVRTNDGLVARALFARTRPIEVRGRIADINYDRGIVAIQPPDPEQRPVIFRVTEDTEITKNGEPARLGAVEVGDYARALLVDTGDGLVALRLDAHDNPPPFPLDGRIVGLDPERQIVAVQPPENDQRPVAFRVTEETVLTKNGQPCRFGDLAIGDFAHALLVDTDRGLIAVELHVRGGQPPIVVKGVIARIDGENHDILIKPADPNMRPVLFHVTPDTRIVKDGEPARFEDLVVGDHAKAVLVDTDRGLVALSICVDNEPGIILAGVIVEINPDARVVVVKLDRNDGEVVRIHIVDRTKLFKNGEPARFGDLMIGDNVRTQVVRTDEGLVALWLAAHTPVHCVAGVVVDVNYERHWFALNVEGTDRVAEFFVGPDTKFMKNGRPARFTDIHVRDQAKVKFAHLDEGNLALVVVARGE